MRVIAGSAKKTHLLVPRGIVRPTSDRVREAVFSMLGERVPGAKVLDLFAGTGALGIEALSRGAGSAVFVEKNRRAAQSIRANLERTGLSSLASIACDDVSTWMKRRPAGPFDLIFADPPYLRNAGPSPYAAALLLSPDLPRMIAPAGLLVLESPQSPAPAVAPPWRVRHARSYGETLVQLIGLPDLAEENSGPSCF
ncbi:MAG TPA: 16S rRNA (guanine(966)-N(2))-methyltransferase RsmD [Verrucomicrobiales bacterium]|nr:16S rRNA (guanine(966)-N(2))-methyltransferase RsmD [Verrucomicrobiales bacterium]